MSAPIMKCGCAATGDISSNGGPALVGCGLHQCTEVATDPPKLEGRTALCSYGSHGERPSSPGLAFFRHRPDRDHDEYYCGCYGWD
jgi:hypothetical protein